MRLAASARRRRSECNRVVKLVRHMKEQDWRSFETFSFGDNSKLADELCALVLAGKKTATCWPTSEGQQTYVGKRMVVLDGGARPAAVLEKVELTKRRFPSVDASFAGDEGDGDGSLRYWREAHQRYFTRRGTFAPDMDLWCERFRIVARLYNEPGALPD